MVKKELMNGLSEKKIREYMELSIDKMMASKQEKRSDGKPSPLVGAVIVMTDGKVDTAYRSELREGDHAEFTLLERKHRADKLDGSILFATLEPCAPGARHMPKLACAERIVNARIKKVYIGIEDPDPMVARKGMAFLEENGVVVEMYPRELQAKIEAANDEFLKAARQRASDALKAPSVAPVLSKFEGPCPKSSFTDLSESVLKEFAEKTGLDYYNDDEFKAALAESGILCKKGRDLIPTGIGMLLFGKNPQRWYPQARIKCIDRTGCRENVFDVEGPLLRQPQKLNEWYSKLLATSIDRSRPERFTNYRYPIEVFVELSKNAILHRDYEIGGAQILFEITDDAVIIKSPGAPVPPISMDSIKSFNAPTLSRNPRIGYAFEKMRLTEGRGLGFSTVRGLSKKDLPIPAVSFDPPYLVITVPLSRTSSVTQGLKADEQRIVEAIRIHGARKRLEIEKVTGFEKKKVNRLLDALIGKGNVIKTGINKSTSYSLA